ncbi:hypothetical protein TNCV_3452141 [Trichonephila clavipes]|nr:hypothetical protein TNCV_3452141 [Trichonephila clavipes]
MKAFQNATPPTTIEGLSPRRGPTFGRQIFCRQILSDKGYNMGYPQSEVIPKLKTQTQKHKQSMRARNYCAHHNTRDHWTLRCMNRCPDLVVCLKRDLQCLRPEASLVLIYRPNVAGMKGRVDLAQPVNRTPDLWCGSTIHFSLNPIR